MTHNSSSDDGLNGCHRRIPLSIVTLHVADGGVLLEVENAESHFRCHVVCLIVT